MSGIIFVFSKEELKAVIAQCDPNQDTLICTITQSAIDLQLALTRYLVIDFDGTMTPETQCRNMLQHLKPHLKIHDEADLQWYLSKFKTQVPPTSLDDYNWFLDSSFLENRTAIEGAWMARTVANYIESELTKEHFLQTGAKMPLRAGIRELIAFMKKSVVISMGIEQMIHGCLDHNDIVASIVANRMLFEKHGRIIGCHRNVVVSSTKQIAARRFQRLTEARSTEIMVVGDSVLDLGMMSLESLNVLILPTDEKEKNLTDFRFTAIDKMWGMIKLVLVGKSFTPLVDLINQARSTE